MNSLVLIANVTGGPRRLWLRPRSPLGKSAGYRCASDGLWGARDQPQDFVTLLCSHGLIDHRHSYAIRHTQRRLLASAR